LATFVATIFIPLFFTWLSGKHVRHHGQLESQVSAKETP
jgi:multidrug efflux pump